MKRVWIFIAIGTFAAACVPWLVSDFLVSVALTCLMYVALATSWSLFCGATRYLSLATSAFFGVGAYTSAVLLNAIAQRLYFCQINVFEFHKALMMYPSGEC